MTSDSATYLGSSWRSRYLRAPKMAFDLADRSDFVRLEDLASVGLGLKTGHDKFFFLRRAEDEAPSTANLLPAKTRRSVRVRGLDGWEGEIPAKDLRPAILNPHQFLGAEYRRLVVPPDTESLYLLPRDIAPKGDLAAYIAMGEREGVHKRKLVHSNSSLKRWYRQTRGVVTSPWALPYNSAFEYGAWDNQVGAVLNGRFVGVEPLDGVDCDLLGVGLNSTFVMLTRLLEGVSTGVEGAFDVGPPAARRIMVPDVRRISEKRADGVRRVLSTMRSQDLMPPAPTAELRVHPLRHELDVSLLQALGCSRGEASAIAGRVYEKYARWRSALERLEMIMRGYRRAMHQSGQSRGVRPTDLAARRVWEEIEATLTLFPGNYLSSDDGTEAVYVARNLRMPDQESFIDPGAVPTGDGKILDLGSHDRVRYAAMLLLLGFEPPLRIPVDASRARGTVDAFNVERTRLRTDAAARAAAYLADARSISEVVELVERLWMKHAREAAAQATRK